MRKLDVDALLTTMVDSHENVSDVIFTVDRPPLVETNGELVTVPEQTAIGNLSPFQTEVLALNLIHGDRRLCRMLLEHGSCDSSYTLPGKARFRANIFCKQGGYSVVMRKIEMKIPTIEDLKLPETFRKIVQERNGLVLITGPTGVGKTTTLAAVLNEINHTKAVHIITLEDPVEFVHPHAKATFNQRELGTDFDTFANGLRAAVRQAPKVILVGEMRDRETVELALKAAETGHLVLSTVHTVDAGQTVNRILGMFDPEEEKQIRQRLADTLKWVVGQRLLPRIEGGRLAIHDILVTSFRSRETILAGESEGKTFYEIQEASNAFGGQTFDQAILRDYVDGLITEETALSYASRRTVVHLGIDRIKQGRGEKTTDIEGLALDKGYAKMVKKR